MGFASLEGLVMCFLIPVDLDAGFMAALTLWKLFGPDLRICVFLYMCHVSVKSTLKVNNPTLKTNEAERYKEESSAC